MITWPELRDQLAAEHAASAVLDDDAQPAGVSPDLTGPFPMPGTPRQEAMKIARQLDALRIAHELQRSIKK